MSWAKVDDQFHSHRKAKRAWKAPRALGLHLLAMSYCAGHLTDGLVDDEFVEEKLPNARERRQATDALVDAGLWVRESDGWRINDWLDYNPSRSDTLARRQRDSDRKARGRDAESQRSPRGVRDVSNCPDPTRPDPTKEETALVEDAAASSTERTQRTDIDQLCQRLATKVRDNGFTALDPSAKAWTAPMRLLLDRDVDPKTGQHWTTEQVAHVIDRATEDTFWRRNVRSPATLRKNFERFVVEIRTPPPKKTTSLDEAYARQERLKDQAQRMAALDAADTAQTQETNQ